MNIFSKKPNPREVLRESKREMTQATRGIEKEISSLQSEEKKLVLEIKRTAKTGNEGATKILARQLIRLRQQIANLQGSRAQMRGIATHTQAMHAHTSVAAGIQGATKAMAAMSKLLRLVAVDSDSKQSSKPLQIASNRSEPLKIKSWFQLAFAVAGGCGSIIFFFFFKNHINTKIKIFNKFFKMEL
ncbi:vacuolar protein sorting-associated protein 2 homolog 3 isoform X2 [Brassica rapa]|uniref:vacuolar protein sorting-associated protein 2 homolog 3 isoform X2 n=1 Tax=Brassica campestris TaxID=3711 RepID=UPI00142DB9F7|nr:vacuolar protein sorting-associated protein 2 homolog 3 isoform X2 [Brassica rapa]